MTYPNMRAGLVMIAPSISAEHEPPNWWRMILNFPLFRWFTPPALKACNQEIIPLKKELALMEEGWQSVMTPTTIVQGMADKLVPMGNATFAKNAMSKNPNVKVIMLENENHFILWTRRDLIQKELLKMLKLMGCVMAQSDDNKFKKQLSITLLFLVYVAVLAYLSNFLV